MIKRISISIIILILCQIAIAENFDIQKFSDPHKYDWQDFKIRKDARTDLDKRRKLLQIYRMHELDRTVNMGRSAVIPGWGHFMAESHVKGQIILGTELILLGSGLYFYDKAMDKYDKYKESRRIDEMNNYYNDAETPYKISQGFLAAYIIVWAYSIYDAGYEADNYNSRLWDRVNKEHDKAYKITVSPEFTGISIKF